MKWIIGTAAALAATGIAFAVRAATRAGRDAGVRIRNRVIYGPGGFVYHITDEDILWLARAIWGESGPRGGRPGAAVAWAMAQYHALVLSRQGDRPKFSTLTNLLRAYCQPINPIWASMSGRGCQRRPDHCTERHLRRRRQITNASWEQIPAPVRELVMRFVQGDVRNPVPGATDWAAYDWQRRSKVPLINISGNKFGIGRDRRIYGEGLA